MPVGLAEVGEALMGQVGGQGADVALSSSLAPHGVPQEGQGIGPRHGCSSHVSTLHRRGGGRCCRTCLDGFLAHPKMDGLDVFNPLSRTDGSGIHLTLLCLSGFLLRSFVWVCVFVSFVSGQF